MSKDEHEHNYVAEKQKYQELDNNYLGDGKYQTGTLEKERIVIFCRTCGDWKVLESTDE
jgi:hypothetical protein